jgi:dihydroorotase
MEADILIKGGCVIDTAQQINGVCDVAIKSNKILSIGEKLTVDAKIKINAEGCIVSPGIVDHHLHMFADATDAGIDPDVSLFPNGVTTAVEGGSPGAANYELYRRVVIQQSRVRIKCYISVSSMGMVTRKYSENLNPDYFERERLKALFEKYPNELVGLKLRFSKNFVGNQNLKPLEETLKLAEEIGCPIVVHMTNPPVDTETIAQMLRPGDIFCHVYQGQGDTIVGSDNIVKSGIKAAREKGVLFDGCNGTSNFTLAVAKAALADNFFPDIISSDYSTMSRYQHPAISMPYIMSKYINMGMKLEDVFRACTQKPAELIDLHGQVGTLAPNAFADVAIFKLINQEALFYDYTNESIKGNKLLVPQMTIRDGIIMFRQVTFNSEFR